MTTSEFTEFSFGYALTDSLVSALDGIGKAPVFPSLFQEGSAGGGYDLELPAIPVPLFLQFKIPQVMVRASSLMPPGYVPPYYRMPLRTKAPNQHRLLQERETAKTHALVLYATPLFHEIANLDAHYLGKTVHTETAFILPSAIGKLNSKPHHLSYRLGALTYWRHSRPTPISGEFTFDALRDRIEQASKAERERHPDNSADQSKERRTEIQRNAVLEVMDLLRSRIDAAQSEFLVNDLLLSSGDDPRAMAARLAYVAQVHFGVTMAWLEGAQEEVGIRSHA